MYLDIPEFSRCCLCIPLRWGLIAWGYAKIVITITLITFISMVFDIDIKNRTQLWIFTVIFILGLFDIATNIMYIVSAHMKNIKLLSVYYRYCKVNLAMNIVFIALSFGYYGYEIGPCSRCFFSIVALIVLAAMGCVALLTILLQVYLMLLLKSEIKKLRNNSQCKFVRVSPEESLLSPDDKDNGIQEERKYDRLEYNDIY